jgi:hypothetical protein
MKTATATALRGLGIVAMVGNTIRLEIRNRRAPIVDRAAL